MRDWNRKNRDRLNAEARARYATDEVYRLRKLDVNLELLGARRRTRYATDEAYRLKSRDLGRRRWALLTPEQRALHNAKRRTDYAADPAPRKVLGHQHRARKRSDEGAGVRLHEWRAILEYFDGRCAYCGRQTRQTVDHVTSFAEGGLHEPQNVVPACRRHNCSKKQRGILSMVNVPYVDDRPGARQDLRS